MAESASPSAESSFDAPATDASSHVASMTSTPPTTVSPDTISLTSEQSKAENGPAALLQDEPLELAGPVTIVLGDRVESTPEARLAEVPAGLAIETDPSFPPLDHVRPSPAVQTPLEKPQDPPTPTCAAIVVASDPSPAASPKYPRRQNAGKPVYNVSKLAGTDIHGRRASKGDVVRPRPRQSDGSATPSTSANGATGSSSKRLKAASALSPTSYRINTRGIGAPVETLASRLSSQGKRAKKTFAQSGTPMSRELKRLRDTNEYAHIDERPVRYTVWSNGKYIDVKKGGDDEASGRAKKRIKVNKTDKKDEEPEAMTTAETKPSSALQTQNYKRVKKWLNKGLYAGQDMPADITKWLTPQEKKKLAESPELVPKNPPNRLIPMPMFSGFRMLLNGSDYKLPYDICHPLPPGQPKPPSYRTMTKNRFVGDAAAYWKKTPHFKDYQSKCICRPEDGCAEQCQNRIMLYECDETNCNIGKQYCTNRAFQDLAERTKKGGPYRIGVEVIKTADRGFGVRSNRCFQPRQIVMEYVGEIVTEEECDRRMEELYKDNECYYLMSFDRGLIIDATSGSIARFVNHSCSPNCEMIKWVVSGQPRMALFAGDKPIMTGDELTYDYNFAPFSKDVQTCLCGSANCRGVLGPKPREVKPPKQQQEDGKAKTAASKAKNAGKRKLSEMAGGRGQDGGKSKRPKLAKPSKPFKRAVPSAKAKVVIKKSGTKPGSPSAVKRKLAAVSVKSGVSSVKVKLAAKSTATKAGAKAGAKTVQRKSSIVSVKAKLLPSKKPVSPRAKKPTFKVAKLAEAGKQSPAKGSPKGALKLVKKVAMTPQSSKGVVGKEQAKVVKAVKAKVIKFKAGTTISKAVTVGAKGSPGMQKVQKPAAKKPLKPAKAVSAMANTAKPVGRPKKNTDKPAAVANHTPTKQQASITITSVSSSGRKRTPSRKSLEAAADSDGIWDVPIVAAAAAATIVPVARRLGEVDAGHSTTATSSSRSSPRPVIQVHVELPSLTNLLGAREGL